MKKIVRLVFLFIIFDSYSQIDYTIASIPKELTSYSNSVLMDELIEIDVTNHSKMKVSTHRVVAVLNKLGDNNVGSHVFYDEYTKVKKLEAYVYNSSGKELEHFKRKDFSDVSRGDGISLYNDDRVLYLNYTPTSYPYIIEFNVETESTDSAFINMWYPVGGYARSTMKSVSKIIYSPENKVKYKAENIEGYNIKIEDANNELVCTATNINTIRYEENSLGFSKISPKVRFALNEFSLKGTKGQGKDWSQFGKWMENSLLTDINDLPEATISRVKSLVANDTTNEAKARKVYQFVQDKVRYISIQIGIGGWKPMLASQVDQLSYGDCKALTNYTKSLLEVVGVPSYYTVLYAGKEEYDFNKEFASMEGNHAILGIPEGEEITFLECTSQDTPYGFLGNFTDDRDVLVVTPEGGKIVHTKIYETSENVQENKGIAKLDAAGNVKVEFNSTSTGLQYDGKYMLPKQKKDDVIKYYKEQWGYINGFSIEDYAFDNNRDEIIFSETATLNIPNYANSVGTDYLFCANIFNQVQDIPPRISDRKQELYIPEGYIHKDDITVLIPKEFLIESFPEETILESKFGVYKINFARTSDSEINYKRELTINKGVYPAEDYETFRDFKRSIARLDRTKLLLKKKTK